MISALSNATVISSRRILLPFHFRTCTREDICIGDVCYVANCFDLRHAELDIPGRVQLPFGYHGLYAVGIRSYTEEALCMARLRRVEELSYAGLAVSAPAVVSGYDVVPPSPICKYCTKQQNLSFLSLLFLTMEMADSYRV